MEKIVFNDTEFTFERVESINELPEVSHHMNGFSGEAHEFVLERYQWVYRELPPSHVYYYDQKSTGGRIYAFTKATE